MLIVTCHLYSTLSHPITRAHYSHSHQQHNSRMLATSCLLCLGRHEHGMRHVGNLMVCDIKQHFSQQLSDTQHLYHITHHRIEQGLTSPPTQYRSSGRQFYRSKDPTKSIKAPKENSWPATRTGSNPTRCFPPCYKWTSKKEPYHSGTSPARWSPTQQAGLYRSHRTLNTEKWMFCNLLTICSFLAKCTASQHWDTVLTSPNNNCECDWYCTVLTICACRSSSDMNTSLAEDDDFVCELTSSSCLTRLDDSPSLARSASSSASSSSESYAQHLSCQSQQRQQTTCLWNSTTNISSPFHQHQNYRSIVDVKLIIIIIIIISR